MSYLLLDGELDAVAAGRGPLLHRLRRVEAEDDGGGLGHVRVRHALPQRRQAVERRHTSLQFNRNSKISPLQITDELFSGQGKQTGYILLTNYQVQFPTFL